MAGFVSCEVTTCAMHPCSAKEGYRMAETKTRTKVVAERLIARKRQIELIRLEVKYCENCGGLWYRRAGDTRIHCVKCSAEVSRIRR